jgi:sugar lactone lactonase YvrE
MATTQIARVSPAQALNGEGPAWDDRGHRLLWIDIREPALHAFDPHGGADVAWEMPCWIGCFAQTDDDGVVAALRTGLYRFDFATGALDLLAPPPFDPRGFIFNDGGCDRQGRFFAGPMYMPLRSDVRTCDAERTGPLWRFDGAGGWSAATPAVSVSNGLAWAPDGKTMYHSDTEQKTIWAYDYDVVAGTAENRRVFAQVDAAKGGPDGAAVDRDGFYWCAVFAQGCLLRFDPDGRLERRVGLPIRYPTMPAFGGPDFATLYVTSANWPLPKAERSKHPDEGCLFAFEAPVPGLPSSRFNGSATSGNRR